LHFWPPHLRRDEKELEKIQGRRKWFLLLHHRFTMGKYQMYWELFNPVKQNLRLPYACRYQQRHDKRYFQMSLCTQRRKLHNIQEGRYFFSFLFFWFVWVFFFWRGGDRVLLSQLVLNWMSSYLSFPSAGITGLCYHAWLRKIFCLARRLLYSERMI
jgi:hypothetical protein